MDINELNKFCNSHLVQTMGKRFDLMRQRKISLQNDTRRNNLRILYAVIAYTVFFLIPLPVGDPRYITAKIAAGITCLILTIGILNYIRKWSVFTKQRTLDEIQAFYGAVFLQTTDKYKTTPRDRNRSLKKAFNNTMELFPYPLYNLFTKQGYKTYLYEWNEILRLYPLWKIQICAIRMMFTNQNFNNIKYIRIEIDYRMEEKLNTLILYNAVIELQGIFFLLTPYPVVEENDD